MPPFLEEALYWSWATAGHFVLMFWWIWLAAIVVTAVAEARSNDRFRRRLIEAPEEGWRTVGVAVVLGILSPPSRRRIFRQARELLAEDVSRAGVLAYLVSAQSLLVWFLFLVVALSGPQPVFGQAVAVAVLLGILLPLAARTPDGMWDEARDRARDGLAETVPTARSGTVASRMAKSIGGQAVSLAWPLVFGVLGVGFFLALGQSSAYVSLQGAKGPLVQLGNAGVGLLVAWVTGAPLVGNALFGAGLWKPEFVAYAGLVAFYLGTMVMPFALPRWYALLGPELGLRVAGRLAVAIVVAALAAAAWWWGLDGLAGLLGVRGPIEELLGSTLRPNDVPWFHHWFAPGL